MAAFKRPKNRFKTVIDKIHLKTASSRVIATCGPALTFNRQGRKNELNSYQITRTKIAKKSHLQFV